MLQAITEIGSVIENFRKKSIDGYILFIILDENFSFKNIEIEQFQNERIDRYLYREGASRGNKSAPIAPLTDYDKTYSKIRRWFEELKNSSALSSEESKIVDKISNVLENQAERIINFIRERDKDFNKKNNRFISVKLDSGNQYLGDLEFLRNAYKRATEDKIQKVSQKDKVCSICGEKRDTVSARTHVFNFDTDDKPGFITGFDKAKYWKNIPVCQHCRDLLRRGRDLIESSMSFNFYGLRYLLIPRSIQGNTEVLREVVEVISDSYKNLSLKDRIKKRITNDEREIFQYLSETEDNITLNFLFLQKQQSAERILLSIDDVFPSRIRSIFSAKDYVDALFEEDFNFGKIRLFFARSDEEKKSYDLDRYFLEIVDSVFTGKGLNFQFIVKFFMKGIREEFIKQQFYQQRTKDAMIDLSFFERLGLINFEEAIEMEDSIFSQIFTKYSKSLNRPEKRAIFLLGSLTQMLLNKQYSERESKPPFIKKLKSLKMDQSDIKALLPEVQNKLEEYDSFDKGKRIIAQEISKYFLEAGDGWRMPFDEINFYFVCGMNLYEEVAKIVYESIDKLRENREEVGDE